MIKNLSLAFVTLVALVGIYSAVAYAATGGECKPFTTCLAASAGQDGDGAASLDAKPATYTETNSGVVMIPIIFKPTGTSNDTGTEVAALIGVDCDDVYAVDPAGGSGDEFTDGNCSTDIADGSIGLMFTK